MDSIKKQYSFRLLSSIISVLLGLVTMGIVPRTLGPVDYGNYSFLRNIFTQVAVFSGLRTEEAFVNYSSRHRFDSHIVSWYVKFSFIVFIVLMTILYFFHSIGLITYLLPDQELKYILIAAIFCYWEYKVNYSFVRFGDAKGLTIIVQKIVMGFKVLSTTSVLFLFYYNYLSLMSVFIYQLAVSVLMIIILFKVFKKHNYVKNLFYHLRTFDRDSIKKLNRYFYRFSSPLIIFSIFVLFFTFFDRWYLQKIAGSIDQGFLNIGNRFSEIIIIFTGSMIPLFFREIAKAHQNNNINAMMSMYTRYSRMFFFIAAYFAGFLIFQMDFLIQSIIGSEFKHAIVPVSIFLLYPIHQTLGQLNGALIMATERTRLARNIGIAFSLVGIPVTIILVSNHNFIAFNGLGLGATGIAVKMVAVQLLSVSTQVFINTRFLGIKSTPLYFHQILTVIIIFITITLSYLLISLLNGFVNQGFLFIMHGFTYSIFVFIVIIIAPSIVGSNRHELRTFKYDICSRSFSVSK